MARKEDVEIKGLKVALRMPIVDSKNSYDILLGRDWLHLTKAIGDYEENSYVITVDGKKEKLQGQQYTKAEVTLSSSDSEEESEEDSEEESEEDDGDDDDGSDEEDIREEGGGRKENKAKVLSIYRAECLDIHPQLLTPKPLKVKVDNLDVVPVCTSLDATGYDLFAVEEMVIPAYGRGLVNTGVSMEIPEGHYGQIKPRSGLALRKAITTDAGVIDRDFRGNIGVILVNHGKRKFAMKKGERIAQIILVKNSTPKVEVVDELNTTERGAGGFGSTGANVVAGAGLLSEDQLCQVDINPTLTREQHK
jgi:deoxyuridine 5'-triphosphate nucleotidohydrolase